MATFSERLRELRQKHDITLDKMADDTGITKATLSRYENGHREPKLDIINTIADYFNVPVDYLLGNTNQINPHKTTVDLLEEEFPEGVQVLRRATKKLNPKARRKMIKLMEAFLNEEDEE
ncbi:helix-turn-helix domain-containing protein [Anaerosolibacter sp.]|uniref:helix-turn-helix domain-containing protein n=1 Tax=Anaerosolibacter sp. TaxID=1872527 RepID=UPI0039EEE350